jgi:hypothetical protein
MIKKLLKHYFTDVILADDFLIYSDRKEIQSTKLVADKDVNMISIGVKSPLQAFGVKKGIRNSDGRIINPEIILVDADGVEYPFEHAGGRRYKGYEFANYEYQGDLPLDKKFEKVLLRCDVPVTATRIQWSGYNIKDLP